MKAYMGIDGRVLEERKAPFGPHRPIQQRVDRHADQSGLMPRVGPLWRRRQDMVQELQHVVEIPYLLVFTDRVFGVLLGCRNLAVSRATRTASKPMTYLVEHKGEQHR
jgi:hypothetical protein